MDLIITNTLREVASRCKIILSHAGGTLPFLISRLATVSRGTADDVRVYGKTSDEIWEDFRSFWFDTALSSSRAGLRLLLELVPERKILYGELSLSSPAVTVLKMMVDGIGSDFPYGSREKIAGFKESLDEFPMDQALREKILFKNAEDILPNHGGRGTAGNL